MDLLPDTEQAELVTAVRQVLTKELPAARLHQLATDGTSLDIELWRTCAAGGWLGLGIPEAYGGVGCSTAEEFLLFVEIGHHLVPGPFLSTVLGAHAALAAGRDDLARRVVSGEATIGLAEPYQDADARLDGTATGRFRVIGGNGADAVLVVASGQAGLIDSTAIRSEPHPCIDPLTDLQLTELDHVATDIVAADAHIETLGTILAAAVLIGIARAGVERSVAYSKEREQYGQPIGSFQAVKHRCAEMAVRAEAAWSLGALAALEAPGPATAWRASSAKVVAADAATRNAADDVQNHGAVGITDADDAHLYVKRARVFEQVCGSTRTHQARILTAARPLASR
jgi:alkylation response protein AidB-like acyl-CoA dehydrogenase